MAIDPAYIALVGTLCGGVGLKVAEHYLGRSKGRVDEASRIRDELRIEITRLDQEIKELEAERDSYRNQYYDLRDKYIALQTELTLALQRIRNESVRATEVVEIVSEIPPPTPPPEITQ